MNNQNWLDRPLLKKYPAFTVEVLLFALIMAIAVVTRLAMLGARAMSHDESLHTYYSYLFFRDGVYTHNPMMHGPFQFHLLALIYTLLGDSDTTARLGAALFSIATVAMAWYWRRFLGRWGALIAGLMLLVSPYMLYYGRYARNESFVAFFGIVMLYAVLRYLETGLARYLYMLTVTLVLHFTAKETAYIYTAELLIFLAGYLIMRLLSNVWKSQRLYNAFVIGLIITVAAAGCALGLTISGAGNEALSPSVPLGLAVLAVMAFAVVAFSAVQGFGFDRLRQERSFDMLILSGTLILPLLSAFLIKASGGNPLDYSQENILHNAIFILPLFAISIVAGLLWNVNIWTNAALLFYAIFILLYTTLFTNTQGFYSGLLGSLGYWLEQQSVQRGSQPIYYYFGLQLPIYEYLPVLASLVAIYFGIQRKQASASSVPQLDSVTINYNNTFGLLVYWSIISLATFTFAGERMPWLTVHIALPFILLGGWGLGQLIDRTNWEKLPKKAISSVLMIIFVFTSLASIFTLLGNHPPFQGKDITQLQNTYSFIFLMLTAFSSGVALFFLLRQWAFANAFNFGLLVFFGLLALLTARSSFNANYVNYNDANEYLVYAHSAAGVKEVLSQVEEISYRTTGDKYKIAVAYDDDVAWPFTWYMRQFPNARYFGNQPSNDLLNNPVIIVGDNNFTAIEPIVARDFYEVDSIRMVWPNQDYHNLTWDRFLNILRDPNLRQSIWNIWLNRDFSLYSNVAAAYAQAEGRYFNPSDLFTESWSPSDRMRLYIRKDVAKQFYEYGFGDVVVTPPDPYAQGKISIPADLMLGSTGSEAGQFFAPRAIAFAPDRKIYVADSRNHRIQFFAPDGEYLGGWGNFTEGANAEEGKFNEPWGVAVAPDGTVFVADTWNHRIQKFSAEGEFIKAWGQLGGPDQPGNFYGPRQVAIGADGHLLIADTGNNRIVVYDLDGNQISQFGSLGLEAGQFYEPTGIAVDANGLVYVADAWNGRIQVFAANTDFTEFSPITSWEVNAWENQSIENKPFIAVDSDKNVYVTDPEGFRVLEFTNSGTFIRTWGDPGAGSANFTLPSGISVDRQGKVWVSDAGQNNRLMRFTMP